MVFELYFFDEVQAAGCTVIDLAGELTQNQPVPAPDWQTWLNRVNDPRQELRNCVVAHTHTVEPVRQIIKSLSNK